MNLRTLSTGQSIVVSIIKKKINIKESIRPALVLSHINPDARSIRQTGEVAN